MHTNVNLDKTNTDPVAQNAFSMRLSGANFDLFPMLVVDLMHELEQGVWKVLFIHLLRMLDSQGSSFINELDLQYAGHYFTPALYSLGMKAFRKSPHLAGGQSKSFHQMPQR
jgi:hypothetical protein